eukprot:CAMPEP_0205943774 /NCGR_PEP_ID=MMETSP1325-20131115/61350_1 /ASSEMBLY_ACC=CAM_ASM_000708 /TAXON_ID=236786 /ORGANISM="Florenciella sp., Strain RCC1007" /LENGTH=46 /DNA_ID= /DNA_START= /DNA_END= /DNA_ORIENTATION=
MMRRTRSSAGAPAESAPSAPSSSPTGCSRECRWHPDDHNSTWRRWV